MSLEHVDSRWLFTLLVAAVAAERGVELLIARRNLRRAQARGGLVAEARSYWDVFALQVLWLVACPLEVWTLDRPWSPALGVPALALVLGAQALRYWVIATLGDRWNLRIVVVPGDPAITSGPYRVIRHPNYLAVTIEAIALPLVHGAWLTALATAGFGAPVLRRRISLEEAALGRLTDYDRAFAGRGRLLP